MQIYPVVLTIAGSDSGGGAGIQADIKTISALGCYAASAITAVTAQDTTRVAAIHPIPPAIVAAQVRMVIDDMAPAAIKTGMIPDIAVMQAVTVALQGNLSPLVVDPVMIATSGQSLVEEGLAESFKKHLLPITTLFTPNLNEAKALTGQTLNNTSDMMQAAEKLLAFGCKAVLVKGGHLTGGHCEDVFLDANGQSAIFAAPYIQSANLHGTGCTLSAAIASFLAQGHSLYDALAKSKAFISHAIEAGKDVSIGKGNGPLNHFFHPLKLLPADV